MCKVKIQCLIGLFFFLSSYIFFSQISLNTQKYVDWAHWFNLVGAVFLLSFNSIFPRNNISKVASFFTSLGVIAHIGLCTIDFILWSFGDNDTARNELKQHISNTPLILYPFIIIGPSLLFIGLATHALNFIKTNTISSLMVIVGAPLVGISFFLLKNGNLMLASCFMFTIGLALLLFRKGNHKEEIEIVEKIGPN